MQQSSKRGLLTLLRSDPLARARDLRDALNCILAQISLVHTNTINIILNPNPITVVTKFTPGVIIFTLFCNCLLPAYNTQKKKKRNPSFQISPLSTFSTNYSSAPQLQIPENFKSCTIHNS